MTALETTHPRVQEWILLALLDLDGAAVRAQVHARIDELFHDEFTPEDLLFRKTRGGETAWRNNVDSQYQKLKEASMCAPSQRGDPWTLTAEGQAAARNLRTDPLQVTTDDDLLRNFRPKSASEYTAHLTGCEMTKGRRHEQLITDYGHFVVGCGWSPNTFVHPRDLVLTRGPADGEWLVEAKAIRRGNATKAVREAIAQLFEYRHFFYDATQRPILLGLFDGPVGVAYVDLLTSLGLESVWRDGDVWRGSPRATAAGLTGSEQSRASLERRQRAGPQRPR